MGVKRLIVVVAVLCIFEQSVSLEVGGILSGNRQGSVPLGISLGEGDLDVEGICSRVGVACLNCTHSISCIPLPSGWLRIPLQYCDEGLTCNAHLGGCSTQWVPECQPATEQFNHVCEQVGIFPDAFDCRKFHMCSPPPEYPYGRPAEHHVAFCPRHYAYDALTAQCKIKLQYGQCESKPTPDCQAIGQSGSLPGSPNHYYVCLSKQGFLYPQIFVCPYGYFFYNNFCNAEPESWIPTYKPETTPIYYLDQTTVTKSTTPKPSDDSKSSEESTEKIVLTTQEAKTTEFPPDTFLADKFDLKNYEIVGDEYTPQQNSFEYSGISIESY